MTYEIELETVKRQTQSAIQEIDNLSKDYETLKTEFANYIDSLGYSDKEVKQFIIELYRTELEKANEIKNTMQCSLERIIYLKRDFDDLVNVLIEEELLKQEA